jgi:hypothetical protein
MGSAVPLRTDLSAGELRQLGKRAEDADQARRLLSLAAVLDGMSRRAAAEIGAMDRQTLRDWAHRFNEKGPAGLINGKAPGPRPKLSPEQKQELKQIVAAGPDPANRPPPYEDVDLFGSDAALIDAVAANGAGAERPSLSEFGRRWGSAEMFELGRLANENPPKLRALDPRGFRRDAVEFHPAYHRLMEEGIAAGLAAMTWNAAGGRGAPPSIDRRGAASARAMYPSCVA